MAERSTKRTRFPGIYQVTHATGKKRFMVSYRIPGAGQRTRTFTTQREAKEFQASVRDPATRQRLRGLEKGRLSLGVYTQLYLERKRNLRPSTRARYEGVARRYIIGSRLGNLPLNVISRDDVEDWVTEMQRAEVGLGSIDKAYRVLRAVMAGAQLEGRTLDNPASRVDTPRLALRDPFFLTANQVSAVADEVPDRHRALVFLLAYTGLRIGEASALRVRNLQLPRRLLTVAENSPEVGGRKLTGETKTSKKRTISFSQQLADELARHLELYGPRRGDGSIDPAGYVFSHAGGGQIRQNGWRARVFQPACRRAEVVRVGTEGEEEVPRVHDLRHTAASLAARAGYTLHQVKELLGHTSIKTTSDLYLHLFPEDQDQSAQRLGELMDSARGPGSTVVELEPRQAAG